MFSQSLISQSLYWLSLLGFRLLNVLLSILVMIFWTHKKKKRYNTCVLITVWRWVHQRRFTIDAYTVFLFLIFAILLCLLTNLNIVLYLAFWCYGSKRNRQTTIPNHSPVISNHYPLSLWVSATSPMRAVSVLVNTLIKHL